MEINSSLDGLKSLLGISTTTAATPDTRSSATSAGSALGSDSVTFSSTANEVAQSASTDGVRMDKVASIQSALAAGTYNVSASLLASKMVDSMLGN